MAIVSYARVCAACSIWSAFLVFWINMRALIGLTARSRRGGDREQSAPLIEADQFNISVFCIFTWVVRRRGSAREKFNLPAMKTMIARIVRSGRIRAFRLAAATGR